MSKNIVDTEEPQMTSQYGAYALHARVARLCTYAHARPRARVPTATMVSWTRLSFNVTRTLPVLYYVVPTDRNRMWQSSTAVESRLISNCSVQLCRKKCVTCLSSCLLEQVWEITSWPFRVPSYMSNELLKCLEFITYKWRCCVRLKVSVSCCPWVLSSGDLYLLLGAFTLTFQYKHY